MQGALHIEIRWASLEETSRFMGREEFPEWASLIENALLWREAWRDENVDHDATFPDTLRFIHFAIMECEK